jgi:hypothetical protein
MLQSDPNFAGMDLGAFKESPPPTTPGCSISVRPDLVRPDPTTSVVRGTYLNATFHFIRI